MVGCVHLAHAYDPHGAFTTNTDDLYVARYVAKQLASAGFTAHVVEDKIAENRQLMAIDVLSNCVDECDIAVVLVTEQYIKQVAQSENTGDFSKMEFAALRRHLKSPTKFVPVALHAAQMDTSTWYGPVGAFLGGEEVLHLGNSQSTSQLIEVVAAMLASTTNSNNNITPTPTTVVAPPAPTTHPEPNPYVDPTTLSEHGTTTGVPSSPLVYFALEHDLSDPDYPSHVLITVRMVATFCRAAGINVFLLEDELAKPEVSFPVDVVGNGVESCSLAVVFLTQPYMKRVAHPQNEQDICRLEFNHLKRCLKSANKFVPVVLDSELLDVGKWTGAVGMILGNETFVNLTQPGDERKINRLIDLIRGKLGTQPPAQAQQYPAVDLTTPPQNQHDQKPVPGEHQHEQQSDAVPPVSDAVFSFPVAAPSPLPSAPMLRMRESDCFPEIPSMLQVDTQPQALQVDTMPQTPRSVTEKPRAFRCLSCWCASKSE